MTQEAFAEKAEMSWLYLAKIESPTCAFGVSTKTLFKISGVIEAPVAKLFEYQTEPAETKKNFCRLFRYFVQTHRDEPSNTQGRLPVITDLVVGICLNLPGIFIAQPGRNKNQHSNFAEK